MVKPYVAASSYLNTAPLCYSFIYGTQQDRCEFLSDASPAVCSDMLKTKRADAAMIPAIEYQRIPELLAVREVCVASKNKVRSVVLASRVPIEAVRSIALDTSSRTSATLIRIILSQFYDIKPVYRAAPPCLADMLETDDAALIIGDPAMLIDRTKLQVYDLAEEWRNYTGLPFVFAFWAVRDDSKIGIGELDFAQAKCEGLAHTQQLAEKYSQSLGLPCTELVTYLTENICYDLDEESLQGLNLYYKLAAEQGLIKEARELNFLNR
jgi:chorismate dehydratase